MGKFRKLKRLKQEQSALINSNFTIILYVVEGSEKMLTFYIVAIF